MSSFKISVNEEITAIFILAIMNSNNPLSYFEVYKISHTFIKP